MKKTLFLLLLCVICVSAYAIDGISSPAEPRPKTDLLESIYAHETEVTATATLLATGRGYAVIRNVDADGENMYLGPADVTATSGMLLKPDEIIGVALARNEKLYGITTSTATATARVFGGI